MVRGKDHDNGGAWQAGSLGMVCGGFGRSVKDGSESGENRRKWLIGSSANRVCSEEKAYFTVKITAI